MAPSSTISVSFIPLDFGEKGVYASYKRVMRFNEKRQTLAPQNRCAVANWYDLEGIALVEFHSKVHALDGDSMGILADALDRVETNGLRGLIVHVATEATRARINSMLDADAPVRN